MPQPHVDLVLLGFQASTMLLSIVAVVYFLYARSRGPILGYVPRFPVPWGPIAIALAVLFALLPLASGLNPPGPSEVDGKIEASEDQREPVEKDDSGEVAVDLAVAALQQVFVVMGFAFVIAVLYQATPRDLGLPASSRQAARDAMIGVVACVAALAPVHMTQRLLQYLMHMDPGESGNELIQTMMSGGPSISVMMVSSLMAVFMAPLCEEVAFRLLLQGWLEKWEDEQLGWRNMPLATKADSQTQHANTVIAVSDEPSSIDIVVPPTNQPPPNDPPQRGVGGLPYGWMPILISSVLFGLAHFGYGPEPVPLFVFALFLGYLYQRTHRILPCIVCHALFNLFTVFQLWRLLFYGEAAQ